MTDFVIGPAHLWPTKPDWILEKLDRTGSDPNTPSYVCTIWDIDRITGMEVCSMSGQLPPTNPIFGRNSFYVVRRRPPTTSYFPSCRLRAGTTSRQENEKSESWEPANRMFVLGMGFVGSFLAQGLKNQEW